jgi:hypothetical protein
MAPWAYNPHAGGVKIPEKVQQRTRQRLLAYAEQLPSKLLKIR